MEDSDRIETEWGVRVSRNVQEKNINFKADVEYEAPQNTENY